MGVNLGDHVSVELLSGDVTEGNLSSLGDDGFTIENSSDPEQRQFTRESVRRVSVRRGHARLGALLGFLAGAAAFVPSACFGQNPDCVDAIVIGGGLGAGVGAIVGNAMHTSTVVYPANEMRLSVSPAVSRGGAGLWEALRF